MNDVKPWYQSKTIWGAIVSVLSLVVAAFGYTVAPEDQELLALSLGAIGVAAGNVVAVYGRTKVTKRVE